MPSAATIRLQIESTLAHRIPSALTQGAKTIRPVTATGVQPLDCLLRGGLPVGAVTELVGPECSGGTTIAASFLAQITGVRKVCAWIDVSNTFDPTGAAAAGVDLERLLWVRCGVSVAAGSPARPIRLASQHLVAPAPIKGLHGGGCGAHPRSEGKGLAAAIGGLLRREANAPGCAEPQRRIPSERRHFEASDPKSSSTTRTALTTKPWTRIEQALRTADLLLQAGGFSAIVLDLASLAPEFVSRVPLATWHRYRLACERTQTSILLLTQYSCAKSSAELLLRLHAFEALGDEATVFTGTTARIEVVRQRFSETPGNVVSLRKPPQGITEASWPCRTVWAGRR